MKDLIYLDASVLVALLVEYHPLHTRATHIFDKIRNRPKTISYLVLDEVIYALTKYKYEKSEVSQKLETLILFGDFSFIGLENENASIKNYLKLWSNHSLHPRDAMHVAIMKENRIKTIATIDTDFIKHKESLSIKIVE